MRNLITSKLYSPSSHKSMGSKRYGCLEQGHVEKLDQTATILVDIVMNIWDYRAYRDIALTERIIVSRNRSV